MRFRLWTGVEALLAEQVRWIRRVLEERESLTQVASARLDRSAASVTKVLVRSSSFVLRISDRGAACLRSPWQNGIAERWVGTVRRELLDHVIVLSERQLRRLLREYVDYYNGERVHTQLRDSPMGRPTEHRSSPEAQIIGKPRVGGLHHRYEWQEAA